MRCKDQLPTVKEIIYALLNEIKAILKEYVHETETALKKRLQRLLITGVIVGVLAALVISLVGSAALFLLIGSLKYLSTSMPVWQAWTIMGLTSAAIAGLLFLVLFIIIKKQLSSSTVKKNLNATGSRGELRVNNGILGDKIVVKDAKIERVDSEINEISQRVLLELETASSKDLKDVRYAKMMLHLSDIHYAKRILQQIGNAKPGAESEIEKRAVIKVLLFSTWLHRLYFIIRSFLMGLISAAVTYLVVLYLGSINVFGSIIIGTFVFVFSLVVTRLFDVQITKATKKIVELMAGHKTIRDFIMNHF